MEQRQQQLIRTFTDQSAVVEIQETFLLPDNALYHMIFHIIRTMYEFFLRKIIVDKTIVIGVVGHDEEDGYLTAHVQPHQKLNPKSCWYECTVMYHASLQTVFLHSDDIMESVTRRRFSENYILNERVSLLRWNMHFCNLPFNIYDYTISIVSNLQHVFSRFFHVYRIFRPWDTLHNINVHWISNHAPYLHDHYNPTRRVLYNDLHTLSDQDRNKLSFRIRTLFEQYVNVYENHYMLVPYYDTESFQHDHGYFQDRQTFVSVVRHSFHIQSTVNFGHHYGIGFMDKVTCELPYVRVQIFTGIRCAILNSHRATFASSYSYLFHKWTVDDGVEASPSECQTVVLISLLSERAFRTKDETFAIHKEVFYYAPSDVFARDHMYSVYGLQRVIDILSAQAIYHYIEEQLLSSDGLNVPLLYKLWDFLKDDPPNMAVEYEDPFIVPNLDDLFMFSDTEHTY